MKRIVPNILLATTLLLTTVYLADAQQLLLDDAIDLQLQNPQTPASQSHISATVNSSPTSCDDYACSGTAMVTAWGGESPYSFNWEDGFVGAVRQNLCAGEYRVQVIDAQGVEVTESFSVNYQSGCIWPGDSDTDGRVTNLDALSIALTYGESGYVRSNNSSDWKGQSATNWNTISPIDGLPNYKYIDADGNGIINGLDVDVIEMNYDLSHINPIGTTPSTSLQGDVPLFIEDAMVSEGERLGLPIHLGTASQIAEDVYGIAFTIKYNPELVEFGSDFVSFDDSWLTAEPLSLSYTHQGEGKVQVVVARKDRLNVTGFGELARLNITIRDDVIRSGLPDSSEIEITDIRLIDNTNTQIGTTVPTTTITIGKATGTTTVAENETSINIFPNPAKELVNVVAEGSNIQTIAIYSSIGQQVAAYNNVNNTARLINIADLSAGVYVIAVKTEEKVLTKKLHIVK